MAGQPTDDWGRLVLPLSGGGVFLILVMLTRLACKPAQKQDNIAKLLADHLPHFAVNLTHDNVLCHA